MKKLREVNNDLWVLETLKRKKNGFFIEAGAYDGIASSNTLILEKYFNWTGVLVEPGPSFVKLKKNRPNSVCINKLLSNKNAKGIFCFFPNRPMYSCTQDQFNKERFRNKIKNAHKEEPLKLEKKECEKIKLGDFLDSINAPKTIDYLSLDIEGSELEVLEVFPFNRYKFRCITIEGRFCNELLISKGYKKVKNPFNKTVDFESYFIPVELLK